MVDRKQEQTIQIEVPRGNLPPYEAANWFNLSYSGPEVELMIGTMDLRAIALAVQGKERVSRMRPEITHRFMLSRRGLLQLQQAVNGIIELMEKSGQTRTDLDSKD